MLTDKELQEKILEEIIKVKNEIRHIIEATETKLLLKIEDLKNTVKTLKDENTAIKGEIEQIQQNQRKNNVIIFGLITENPIIPENICEKLNQILELNLKVTDLNDIYKLGKKEGDPIKVEFLSSLNKKRVLQNGYKLKGTNIFITQDRTPLQRERNKILRKHLVAAKEDYPHKDSYIKNEKLYVNGEVYTVEDLLALESIEGKRRNNSAPPTPEPFMRATPVTQINPKNQATIIPETSKTKSSVKPKSKVYTPPNRVTRKHSANK